MPQTYQVQQGDHLSRIAKQFGFTDFHVIWDHPNNQALKAKRGSPNVLYPGDRLYIPDKQQRAEQRATDQKHVFKVSRHPLQLCILLREFDQTPVKNTPCRLEVETESFSLRTDGNGRIEQSISSEAQQATLILRDRQIQVKIGYLDPVDTPSGQIARLTNLGYYRKQGEETDAATLQSAVEEFQCDQMGHNAVDGVCGPRTQAALKQAHGS